MTSMMKYWHRFWICRKQDDRVKVMLVFFLIGIGFLMASVYNGIQVCTMLSMPVEYVLSGNGSIKGVEDMEDTAAVSAQKEASLTLSGTWGEMTVDCLELSESYLALAYGVSETGAMKVIYLNQSAYEQFLQNSSLDTLTKDTDDLRTEYRLDDNETGEAKIRVLTESVENGKACAFCAASSAGLSDSGILRVQLEGQDLDGLNLQRLQKLGFTIVNSDDVQKNAMMLEMQLVRIRYGCLVTALCILTVACLKKYGHKLDA